MSERYKINDVYSTISLRVDEELYKKIELIIAFHSTTLVKPTKVDIIKGLINNEIERMRQEDNGKCRLIEQAIHQKLNEEKK
ncbi:MAG: hypothetical protein ABS948_14540 [Solibacillus sp.]